MSFKAIIKNKESEEKVFDYEPKDFPLKVYESASDFVTSQGEKKTDFVISELAAEQAGVAKLNRQKIEERVEAEALEKLKAVEEKAYQEAYDLGLIEGAEKAFQQSLEEFSARVSAMDEILLSLDSLKKRLLIRNEAQFLKILTIMASKIAMKSISEDKESIFPVIQKLVEEVQTDEDTTVYLNQEDFIFLGSVRERLGKKSEFLKKIKLETMDDVEMGGCILETNYGAIDATIQQRIDKMWSEVSRKFPIVKNKEGEKFELREKKDDEESVNTAEENIDGKDEEKKDEE